MKNNFYILSFSDVFTDVTRHAKKIPVTNYLSDGVYPIFDQSKKYISGYYNQDSDVFFDVPAIIFGDHTRIRKYVDVPCFIGADGVKLLKGKIESNPKYLFYALSSINIPNTGYNRHFKLLKEAFFKIRPIEIQNKIVKELDLINIIKNRKLQQLAKLDELAKSRFLEMFGDPILNPYGFKIKKLGEVCDFYAGTGFPNIYQGKADGDFPFYKVGDISNNAQKGLKKLEHCNNYINKDIVDKIHGTIIPPFTVVFAKIGEALKLNRRGMTTRYCLVDNNAMGIKPKAELNINYFFQFMQDLDMGKYSASTTVPSVRKTTLENIPILVPNFEMQNKYNLFIEQLDKSKFRMKKCLKLLSYIRHL